MPHNKQAHIYHTMKGVTNWSYSPWILQTNQHQAMNWERQPATSPMRFNQFTNHAFYFESEVFHTSTSSMGNEHNEAHVTLEPIQHKSNFRQKKQRDTISANYFIHTDIKTLKVNFMSLHFLLSKNYINLMITFQCSVCTKIINLS